MECIHYGSSRYDPKKWRDVHGSEGGFFNKPDGGLWASPIDAEFGWREWCERERFEEKALKRSFRFNIAPPARILELTPENVWDLPGDIELRERIGWRSYRASPFGKVVGIDFEKLSEDYDVLVCSITKYPALYRFLCGWDCDCILVLNKEVIVVVD